MSLFALKSTEKWKQYWQNRKIDWNKDYLQTWNHPHRYMITGILKSIENEWKSLMEIGCGSGPNLVNIIKHFNNKQVGGVDVNKDAIKLASESFRGGHFKVGSGEDIMMSDDSCDVVLTDMMLIYVSPSKIDKYVKEIKRIGRKYIVLCEFHSYSFWSRMKLRMSSGYNAYDYRKLLEKYKFYDIELYKIPEEAWPGGNPQKDYGYIIKAKIPKRK